MYRLRRCTASDQKTDKSEDGLVRTSLSAYIHGMSEHDKSMGALMQRLEAELIPFGPAPGTAAEAGSVAAPDSATDNVGGVQIAASFGEYEAEYAAIRRHVAIFHQPQRAIIDTTGTERIDFLNRLCTNNLATLAEDHCRRAFQLNHKGRIIADFIAIHDQRHTLLHLDRFQVEPMIQLLNERLFTEDVQIDDRTSEHEHVSVHGPAAMALLDAVAREGESVVGLEPWQQRTLTLGDTTCRVYRRDELGVTGLHLILPVEDAAKVYQQLLDAAGYEVGVELDGAFAQRRRASLRGRPIGWLAYNTARIEAGCPLYHIDFGPDSLPAETGILDETVSFTKGCYLGQEIVARMKNLGHPKRMLVGFKMNDSRLPLAGAEVFAMDREDDAKTSGSKLQARAGQIVGGVTSSTLSPFAGSSAIGYAVMKWGQHQPGTRVFIPAEGELVTAEIQGLHFLALNA